MMRVSSEAELLQAFRELDRGEVQLPNDLAYPMLIKDCLRWVEPSGHRVFLVFEDARTGRPTGMVFQRSAARADVPASMCQWCHSVRPGRSIGLLTVAASRTRRIGALLCADLSCRDNVTSTPGVNDFHEGLSRGERVHRVLRRMSDFAAKNLF